MVTHATADPAMGKTGRLLETGRTHLAAGIVMLGQGVPFPRPNSTSIDNPVVCHQWLRDDSPGHLFSMVVTVLRAR